MSFFTPPTTDGVLMHDPEKVDLDGAHNLWRFFGSWAMGKTVWRDQALNWHETIYPYQGGQIDRVFRKGVLIAETTDTSVQSLANAVRVYEGGHVHPLTAQEEADLIAAGYGAFITP